MNAELSSLTSHFLSQLHISACSQFVWIVNTLSVCWGLADCLCGTTYYTHSATEASLYTVQTAWLSLYTLYTTVQINLLTKH